MNSVLRPIWQLRLSSRDESYDYSGDGEALSKLDGHLLSCFSAARLISALIC